MPIVTADQRRHTQTPNAVMTTLASPSLGGAEHSLWRVEMAPGAAGPAHLFDCEQTWTAVSGAAELSLDGEPAARLREGDTVVLPAGVTRQIVADARDGFAAIVTGAGDGRAILPDGTDRGVPPWVR